MSFRSIVGVIYYLKLVDQSQDITEEYLLRITTKLIASSAAIIPSKSTSTFHRMAMTCIIVFNTEHLHCDKAVQYN